MCPTKIKICGLFRTCDAEYVNEAMPDYAGFVFYEKSHRFVTNKQAEALRCSIKPTIQTVGVFVNLDVKTIEKQYKNGTIDVVQLHGDEDEGYIRRLRERLPCAEIWKAFKVKSAETLLKAENCSADRILLDNGYGTGQSFDWTIADSFKRQFILAGGLNPDNIQSAIERFQPFAIDLSSGVESGSVKDRNKILAAVAAAKL